MYTTTDPPNELSDRCPSNCRCVYRPENITLHVYCLVANLSSLPLDLPPLPKSYVKYKLDFSNNKLLRRLEHRPYFVNTSIMDVRNCGLDLPVFKLANFRGTIIRSFPKQTDAANISAWFLIGENSRKLHPRGHFILNISTLRDSLISFCSGTSVFFEDLIVTTVGSFGLCDSPEKRYLIVIVCLSAVVATLVLVIAIPLPYKLRRNFYRRWKFHLFDRDECVGEDMDYDVFL